MDDLLSVSVSSLIESKTETYWALNSDSLQNVLDKLRKYNIISLPILDSQGKVLGILSVLDIAVYMTWGADDIACFRSLAMRAGDILGFWPTTKKQGDHTFVCNGNSPLLHLLEPFSNGAHRVLVPHTTTTSEAMTYRILSQSDVVRYLWHNKDKFSALVGKPLSDLGITTKPVVCITTNTKAVVGFRTMVQEKVPAVAIVDIETQHIVGTLSASDLRGLKDSTMKLIFHPVCEYLKAQHGTIRQPVVVTLSTPLHQVMELLVTHKIHRTWIVDSLDDPKPCGCLSLTDVIHLFKR